MKKSELKEIRSLEIKDLTERVKKTKQDLVEAFMVRSESGKGSKDVKAVFKKRKDIAQMMTILRQKQLVEELKKEIKV